MSNRTKKESVTIIALATLVILAAIAIAGGTRPYFNPIPPRNIICYQNSTCYYDFNATDDEGDPINFSIDTPPFSNYINPDTGVFNFTPNNAQVGTYNQTWVIVKEIDTGQGNYEVINWTIVNINDPPYLVEFYPEEQINVTIKENAWKIFNVTADDIDLEYGDHLNYTWLIDGNINETLLNSTDAEANFTPDFFSAGEHNITVNVSDSGNLSFIVNWTVNVTNENRAPIFVGPISNITMLEDTPSLNELNLDDYFYDLDYDDYPLSYSAAFVSGGEITFAINETEPNNVSLFPSLNFYGINVVQFRCWDGYNYTYSHNVTINVTGENDAPIVTQLENQTAYAGTTYQKQIVATDPESDPMTYYHNSTLSFGGSFGTTGFISTIFVLGDVGNYSIAVNVSDGQENTTMIFNLSIITNSAPVLGGTPIPDMYTTEGNLTRLDFNATDADLPDTITFDYISVPPNGKFELTITNTSSTNASAYMQFTPEQADVGTYTITINATDDKGSSDTDTFIIDIANVEHTPVLLTIPNYRMKVNLSFNTTVNATDDDGDITYFTDNTTLFDIITQAGGSNARGFINFTPNDTQLGPHWVNITVNDSSGRVDWQVVLFNVTLNTPPTLEEFPNVTALEDHRLYLDINATDPDPQDTLTFYDNTTLFDINNLTGEIDFVPNVSQIGSYIINITVGDGYANVSTLTNITIGEFNDYPYWDPPLSEYYTNITEYLSHTNWDNTTILNYTTNMTLWNSSIYEKNLTRIYLNAYDEETPTLTFSVEYINFTNASGDTVTTGIDLINITSYDGDTALAILNPNNSQVGVYYINFTIDDTTGRINNTMQRVEVFNVNDAPTIINYTPSNLTNVSMYENSSKLFNVTATDIDYGDELHYQWVLDGNNITGGNQSNYNYTTGFLSSGIRNLTVLVLDNHNLSTTLNWSINVTNVNRIGWYGQLREYNSTHFNSGVTKINLTVLPGEDGIVLGNTGAAYLPSAWFESQVLDTGETNYLHAFSTINWTGNITPPGGVNFGIDFQIRTAEGVTPTRCPTTISSNYSNTTYTAQNSQIQEEDERCIQYKLILSTDDTAYTPSINGVTLGYVIANKTQEQNTNQSWVDLDIYFHDPDTDDTLTYNVSDPDGLPLTGVNLTIDNQTNKVYVITTGAGIGTVDMVFHMFDGYNVTDSNVVSIEIIEAETFPEVIIIPVGGGGSVSQPVPYEVPKYVSTPVSFRLIAPQAVTTYANQTIEVPINIFNQNFTMENLKLKATTNNKDVVTRLSRDQFSLLEPNAKEFITLFVESYKTYGTYEILIEAEADAKSFAEDGKETTSHFTERAKVFVNSLLKAEGNETQVNTKLAFAEDLLSTNQECLELNEFLKKTQDMVEQGKQNEAAKMLDQIIESCKYLIAPKELKPEVEEPIKVYGMPTESAFILGTVALVTLIVAISLIIGWSHIKSKKKELTKRNE